MKSTPIGITSAPTGSAKYPASRGSDVFSGTASAGSRDRSVRALISEQRRVSSSDADRSAEGTARAVQATRPPTSSGSRTRAAGSPEPECPNAAQDVVEVDTD